MRHPVWLLAALIPALPATASAQQPHPRRARIMFVLASDAPAVFVAPDQVWSGPVSQPPVSVCGRRGCARVVDRGSCETPACPGGGERLVLEREVADVDDFPEDLEDWKAELDAMAEDPELAGLLSQYRGSHPDDGRDPPGWRNDDHDELQWELSFGPSVATASDVWQVAAGGTFGIGFRYAIEYDSYEEDEDFGGFFQTVFGDTFGADLRVHVHAGTRAQDPDWMVAVGVAPVMLNAVGDGRFRVPALPYGLVVPELGVIAREDRPAAFYVGWNLPVAYLVSDDLGLEARGTVMMVDGWAGEDDVEWVLGASLDAVMR